MRQSKLGQSKRDLPPVPGIRLALPLHPSVPSAALLPTPAPDPEHPGDWTGANCSLLAPPPPVLPRDVRAERGGAACWVPAPPDHAAGTCPLKERGACANRATPWALRRTAAFLEHLRLACRPHLAPLVLPLSSSARRFRRAGPCIRQCFSASSEPRWWRVSGRGGPFSTADSASLHLPRRSPHVSWRILGKRDG